MKRTWLVSIVMGVFLLLAMMGLAACSPQPGTQAPTTATTTVPTIAPTSTTAAATTTTEAASGYEWSFGEAVEFDGMVIAVDTPITDAAPRNLGEGMVAWLTLVTVTNERNEPIDYSPVSYRMVDAEGFTYGYAIILPSKPELDSASLAPGQTVKGYVSFELPQPAIPAQVVFEDYDASGQKWLALWQ